MTAPPVDSLERALRDELVCGDAMIGAARPILRHLLANEDYALFSEEMVAHVRGMIFDVAAQLLGARAEAAGVEDRANFMAERQESLARALFHDEALIGHAHALSLEAQLAERLQREGGIDGVRSPLVEDLAAAGDRETADLAMALLAAQARFLQQQRRMELPLAELPGDIFHKVLLLIRPEAHEADASVEEAERTLRAGYDEGAGRLALLARFVSGLGDDRSSALSLGHAGLAIFATAVAMASGQDRDLTVHAFSDRQFSRLVLALRAAGLGQQAIAAQFLLIHPDIALPTGLESIAPGRALELLAGSRRDTGS